MKFSQFGFREVKLDGQTVNQLNPYPPFLWKKSKQWRKRSVVTFAFLENTASVVVAATVVGAAATLLIRTSKAPETANAEIPVKVCEDCGGSGICAECKGEGFVLKKLSDENAERARLSAKNMATRYTAGLPKKWSYCTKCSSARSCSTCGGSGQLSL
ncbi:hypothetical protein Sjap_001421 [Stephania japonica]|uniref:DUF7895 domain-containing protein n=1 Tax=Stephania japonica TaxID=461633 RepID=A0AAP0PV09_9MAGN